MKIISFLTSVVISASLIISSLSKVQAESSLSRFNTPKYKGGFTHFSYVNPNAPKGGKLRMATVGKFDCVNSDTITSIAAQGLSMTQDPLMKKAVDDPFTWYPLIAESVEVAPDFSQVTFHLDPRAQFHDGKPINAEDIQFSIELLRDKGLPRYKKYYSRIEAIRIQSPRVITIVFKADPQGEYDRELPMIMANLHPLSKKDLQGVDFQQTGLRVIMGSGPYKVKTVDQGRKIVFERHKSYWAKDLPVNKGQYNFDEIGIEYFKNDQTLRQAFKAGEVDTYFETNQRKWNTDYDFPAVRRGDVVQVSLEHKRPVTVWTPIFNLKNPLFQDQRVRKAIAMAFDFHHINKVQFHGDYKRMNSLFANTHYVSKDKPSSEEIDLLTPVEKHLVPEILTDPVANFETRDEQERRTLLQTAGKLLDEAGWEVASQGAYKGIRVHKNSQQPLRFVFFIKDPLLEGMVLAFRDALKRLGVDMEVRRLDVTQYEKHSVNKTFDMILHPWSNSLSPGIEQEYYFDPKAADQPGSSNYIGAKNEGIYHLAQKLSRTATEAELVTHVKAFDRAVMGMYYFIPGVYDNWIRFAYWKNHVVFPAIDPAVGTNAPEWWWSVRPLS